MSAGESQDAVVGQTIERLRTARGLTQVELVHRLTGAGLGWSQGTLSRVEDGRRPVRLVEAIPVAAALGVDVAALLPASIEGEARRVEGEVVRLRAQFHDVAATLNGVEPRLEALHLLVGLTPGRRGRFRVTGTALDVVHLACMDPETDAWLIDPADIAAHLGAAVDEVDELRRLPDPGRRARAAAEHLARQDRVTFTSGGEFSVAGLS